MKLTISTRWLCALMSVFTYFLHPISAEAYTIKRGATGKAIHWETDVVTFQLSSDFEAMLPGSGARRSFDIASDAWRGLPDVPDVSLVSGEPGELGYHGGTSNGVYLVPDAGYPGHKLAVTVATLEEETGRTVDTDIIVNASQPFDILKEHGKNEHETFDLPSTLTHEVGHVLGLGESNDDSQATMWPNMDTDTTAPRTLELDDEHGAILLYREAGMSSGKGCGHASVAETNRSSWIGFVFSCIALALFYRRKLVRVAAGGWIFLVLVGAAPSTTPEPSLRIRKKTASHVTLPSMVQRASFRTRNVAQTSSYNRAWSPMPAGFESSRAGRAHLRSVKWKKGWIWSSYEVSWDAHTVISLETVGGTLHGLRQRVGNLPELRNHQEVVVHKSEQGISWAFKANGHWYGAPIRSLRK